MYTLNKKSTAIFMQLVDRMGSGSYLHIKHPSKPSLYLHLKDTGIRINSRDAVANLFNLRISVTSETSHNPGMQLLVVDKRTTGEQSAVEIFPVSYRQDGISHRVECVTIINGFVSGVNNSLSKQYANFANVWLKRIAADGYLIEYLPKMESIDQLVCSCGNTANLDGFTASDERGNELSIEVRNSQYILCNNCFRIIDVDTRRVMGTKPGNPKTSYTIDRLKINKPLVDMSTAEKARLLHTLFPHIIRGFLTFALDRATIAVNDPETLRRHFDHETLTADTWLDLARIVKEKITTSMDRLVMDNYFFAMHLFEGLCRYFMLSCLSEYIAVCENQRLNNGIEFIFDL